jgi:hypothetical protein
MRILFSLLLFWSSGLLVFWSSGDFDGEPDAHGFRGVFYHNLAHGAQRDQAISGRGPNAGSVCWRGLLSGYGRAAASELCGARPARH